MTKLNVTALFRALRQFYLTRILSMHFNDRVILILTAVAALFVFLFIFVRLSQQQYLMVMNNSFVVLGMCFVHAMLLLGKSQLARFAYTYFVSGIMIAIIYQVGHVQLAWVYCGCVMLFFGSTPNRCLVLALIVVTAVSTIVHGQVPFYEWLKDTISLYCIVFMIYAYTRFYSRHESELHIDVQKHKRTSRLDTLTGLLNRRAYDERMEQVMGLPHSDADRDHYLILMDIDYFKHINDFAGHDVGDEVLRRIALILMEACEEKVYRYGGEEFIVVMPNVHHKEAIVAAERLRQSVESAVIPEVQNSNTLRPFLTISIGVAGYRQSESHTYHDWYKAADKALYRSKHEGKNKTTLANSEPEQVRYPHWVS